MTLRTFHEGSAADARLGMFCMVIDVEVAPEFCMAAAIYQKAEALYAAGHFEHALVHYCRGYRMRKEKQCFRLGVQKAQEAISNAMGSCEQFTNQQSGWL